MTQPIHENPVMQRACYAAGVYPDKDLIKLIDTSSLERHANGDPIIPAGFFQALRKDKPQLFGQVNDHLSYHELKALTESQMAIVVSSGDERRRASLMAGIEGKSAMDMTNTEYAKFKSSLGIYK